MHVHRHTCAHEDALHVDLMCLHFAPLRKENSLKAQFETTSPDM